VTGNYTDTNALTSLTVTGLHREPAVMILEGTEMFKSGGMVNFSYDKGVLTVTGLDDLRPSAWDSDFEVLFKY